MCFDPGRGGCDGERVGPVLGASQCDSRLGMSAMGGQGETVPRGSVERAHLGRRGRERKDGPAQRYPPKDSVMRCRLSSDPLHK